jgi:hypothetical protein
MSSIRLTTKPMLICFTIIITALALVATTTIIIGSLSVGHLALAQQEEEEEEEEEDKVIPTSQDDDDDEQISLSRDEKEGKDDNDDADIASSTNTGQKVCRKGDVLADNHDPDKYDLLSRCEEVFGTIEKDEGRQHDGDLKYLLDVGDEYKYLLNDENYEKTDGMLVIEINPADQDSSMIEIPEEGDRVRVIGAWVTDGETLGWNEIHPAWQIEVF